MYSEKSLPVGRTFSAAQVLHVVPALVLIAGALVSSLSPLQSAFLVPVWMLVFAAAGLAAGWDGKKGFRMPALRAFSILDLALLCLIASSTTQAIAAVSLPAPFLRIHETPGIVALFYLLAALLAAGAARLVLRYGSAGRLGAALLGAGLFSSTLYLRSMVVGEAGALYAPVVAFFVLALLAGAKNGFADLRRGDARLFWTFAAVFVALLFVSALLSQTPGDSLPYALRMLVTVGLSAVLAVAAGRFQVIRGWMVWCVILLAGLIPVLLAVVKFFSLAALTDALTALGYRLHFTELGGGNLFARLPVIAAPFVLYQWMRLRSDRRASAALLILLAGMALTVYQSLSWEGKISLVISMAVFAVLAGWERLSAFAARRLDTRAKRIALAVVLVLAAGAAAVSFYRLAPSVNVASFNGRQIHWKAALLAWRDHPIFGGGSANAALYTPYYNPDRLGIVHVNQQILDDPLFANNLPKRLTDHAHNLFLEIASSSGTLVLLAFAALLVELVRVGLKRWHSAHLDARWLAAACLAGIAGELAWGVLDVLRVVPPFFSFPVWVLVGLLMVPRFEERSEESAAPRAAGSGRIQVAGWLPTADWLPVAAAVLAAAFFLLPSIAASFYTSGFLAFQEQRWEEARPSFERAAAFEPYNPKYLELLAETRIQLGDWDQAAGALRGASALRSRYSPYLYRLGWLAWMQGDTDGAAALFERAIQEDPGEILQKNLYASLAIDRARAGQAAEAVDLFARAALVSPETQPGPEWMRVLRPGGGFDLMLDPAYLGDMNPDRQQRIGMQLGTANLLPRQFRRDAPTEAPLSYARVLERMQQAAGPAETPFKESVRRAILAEVAGRAGFLDVAKQSLLRFQSLTPNSSYGYRKMAEMFLVEEEPAKAQEMLAQATAASPGDMLSQTQFAQGLLARQDSAGARASLDRITAQRNANAYDVRLRNIDLQSAWLSYYRSVQDWEGVEKSLRSLVIIRGDPRDSLDLAAVQRQRGRHADADQSCLQAASEAMKRWMRPWDGTLYDIAVCVGQSPDKMYMPQRLSQAVSTSPFLGKVLVGHLYRATGLPVRALETYQEAEALRPDEGAVAFFIAESYQVLGNMEQVEAYYRKAAALDPYESLPLLKLGQIQRAQKRDPEALKTFEEAAALTPGWADAQLQLANLKMELGDPDAAAAHYRLAQEAQPTLSDRTWLELLPLFPFAERKTGEIGQMYGMTFTINAVPLPVIWMHPSAEAAFQVSLPAGKAARFSSRIALSPDSWGQAGDGVTFTVRVRAPGSPEAVLFEQYINPKANPAERGWLPAQADLSAYAGQEVTLILSTGPGPEGNYEFDWAGWGSPRIETP